MTEPVNPPHRAPTAHPSAPQETPPPPPRPPRRPARSAFADGVPAWALFAAAAALLLLFVAFVIFLLVEAGRKHVTETEWARMYLLFGSAEAIAFTVIGWLFGRQVGKTAVRAANAQTKTAKAHEQSARQGEHEAKERETAAHHDARQAREESHRHQLAAEQLKERARAFLVMAPQRVGTERLAGPRKATAAGEPAQPADDLVTRATTLFGLDDL